MKAPEFILKIIDKKHRTKDEAATLAKYIELENKVRIANKNCKHEKKDITAEFMGAGFIRTCKCGKTIY